MTDPKNTPSDEFDDVYSAFAIWNRPLKKSERLALALAYRIHMSTPKKLRQYSNGWDMGTMLTQPERIYRGKYLLQEAFAMVEPQFTKERLAACVTRSRTADELLTFIDDVIFEHEAERKKKDAFCDVMNQLSDDEPYEGDVYCMTGLKWLRCDGQERAAVEACARLKKLIA